MKKEHLDPSALLATPDELLTTTFPGYTRAFLRKEKKRALETDLKKKRQKAIKITSVADFSEKIKVNTRIDQLQSQLAITQRENKILYKQVNIQQELINLASLSLKALPPPQQIPKLELKNHQVVESAVLVGSCWHIGEVIKKDEMRGLNEYNFEIFIKRLQKLIDTTISFTKRNMQNHVFEEVVVLLTGDMVSGIIHAELRETNEINIVQQATIGSFIVAQAISDLAHEFPKVRVVCVVGNHGRVTEQKYFKGKAQINWDFIFYNYLALQLKAHTNVKIDIAKAFWAGTEIQDHNFLVMHGDLIKSWGSIPFYGLSRKYGQMMQIEATRNNFFQYFVASHFHTKAVLQTPGGEQILNGSLKGGDEYAMGLGLYGEPIQLLFGVHKQNGKTWELSINTQNTDDVDIRYHYDLEAPLADQV